MAVYFFDTSALVKRYVHETGSAWVGQVTDPKSGNKIYITRITGVEVVSALMKKARDTKSPLPLGDAKKKLLQNFVMTSRTNTNFSALPTHFSKRRWGYRKNTSSGVMMRFS